MVKLGTIPQHFDAGQNYIVSLVSLGFVLCLIVVVVGIKFRWFKQRLNFEPIPTGPSGSGDNGQVVLKRASRSSQEQFCEPVMVQGVFRQKLDEDVVIERPKTLPPIRIRKASRGPPAFGPPKRNETPITPVEEPVAMPPPPPPLPSSSSKVSFSQNGAPSSLTNSPIRMAPKEDGKVTFNASATIITNGEVDETYEELKTEENQSVINYNDRRLTGYVRPTEEMVEELKKIEREPPEIQPRTTTSERPRETFKKNAKAAKITVEPLKGDDEENEDLQMGQRRLTGFFPPSNGESENMEELFQQCSERKTPSKVVFNLEDDEDDDDEDEEPNIPPPPPVLLSTQLSTDEERNSTDSWSAIQRHRNLAQEISEQHEAMQNRRRENAEASANDPVPEYRNPLAGHSQQQQQYQQQQPKPRTMRDMKRNNAKNDLFIDNDRNDFEA